MYDLEKIVIISKADLNDKECLTSVVMRTNGLKVTDLLYLDDANSIKGNKKVVKKELKDQLYDDMYDDDLNIRVKEVYDGNEVVARIATFIDNIWTTETMVYAYDLKDSMFNKLHKEIEQYNGKIYLDDYYNIFVDGREIEKDILTIMKEQGLKTENMIKDSHISFIYFLHALVEKMMSK